MAVNRIIVDIDTEEPMSEIRLNTVARELSAHAHTLVVEPEDGVLQGDANYKGHVHVSSGGHCEWCIFPGNNSYDNRS